MKTIVKIHTNNLKHNGKHEGYSYNELQLRESSGRRLYFTAINKGIRMITVVKMMKLAEGRVFVTFGKVKYEIGTYEEVAA
ncbi:hypothetical protein [Lederbergia lenta]|uniref:hypothetical protein n=1 Tax=Lederbergia lenta TaxID=1467 RepID=UPI00203B9B85|nr:hypothetical protein [Lederbergia lenta]MCM3109992.1 hypothetical protein [Lederbergia lenta]